MLEMRDAMEMPRTWERKFIGASSGLKLVSLHERGSAELDRLPSAVQPVNFIQASELELRQLEVLMEEI